MPRTSTPARESAISLCLVAIFLTLAIHFMGLSNGDDSFYLWTGDFIKPIDLFGPQDWSPLYCLWFKLLSLIAPNPVARYFLSWGILAALTSLIPTLLKISGAWLYCFLIVGVPLVTVGPFVSLFAGAAILLGLCTILQKDSPPATRLTLGCAVSFVVAFSRPEFSFCVFLFAAATIVALLLERTGPSSPTVQRRLSVASLAFAATVLCLACVVFLVFTRSHSSRSGRAFAQHYNTRAAEWGIIPGGPNAWRSDYAERRFGIDTSHNALNGDATIEDFLRANPRLFFGHLYRNLLDPKTFLFLLFAAAVLGVPWLRQDAKPLRPASLWLGLLTLPPTIGMIVIYPRAHYALIVLPALLLFALQLFKPQLWRSPSLPWVLGLGLAVIWLRTIGMPLLLQSPIAEDRVNLLRAECIRSVDRSTDIANPQVFDASSVTAIYFVHPRTVTHPPDLPQWAQFTSWVTHTNPAWITVDDRLAPAYNLTQPQLDAFLKDTAGYTPHPCPEAANLTVFSNGKP